MARPIPHLNIARIMNDDAMIAAYDVRAMPSARATRSSTRARILGLGLSAGIAIAAVTLAGCDKPPSPQERIAHRAEQMKQDEDLAFRGCIDEVVGAFSAASVEVVRECRAHAKEVAGATR